MARSPNPFDPFTRVWQWSKSLHRYSLSTVMAGTTGSLGVLVGYAIAAALPSIAIPANVAALGLGFVFAGIGYTMHRTYGGPSALAQRVEDLEVYIARAEAAGDVALARRYRRMQAEAHERELRDLEGQGSRKAVSDWRVHRASTARAEAERESEVSREIAERMEQLETATKEQYDNEKRALAAAMRAKQYADDAVTSREERARIEASIPRVRVQADADGTGEAASDDEVEAEAEAEEVARTVDR